MASSSVKNKYASAALAVRLPETAFTRSGIAFCPIDEVWDWTDGPFRVYLDFRKIGSPLIRESFKHTLLVFAKCNSASYLANIHGAFLHFLRFRADSQSFGSVNAAEISNYAALFQEHQKWRIGTLNVLLQKWVALGLAGVEPDCTQYLRERRKPGNKKGAAVRTRDPVHGPFSEAEYSALYKAVDEAYGTGEIPKWIAVLTRLLFACGGRISQYASLKIMDLNMSNGSFIIDLPQVKTRELHSRVSTKQFDLSPQTGRLVMEYAESLKSLGHQAESALFPEEIVMSKGSQAVRRDQADLFFGHCTSKTLSRVFIAALDLVAPPTERLEFDRVPVAPRRFRYTFGTRLAEEGASKTIIADRLGHADLQHVDVYFEASPAIVESIDKAMGAQLAPLARAFRGRLVEDEEHSTHEGAPGSRIIDFRVSQIAIGSCGSKGQGCAFNKPIACYTCFKFEPWLDAPHEKVLKRLQGERERWINDERMAAINDDAMRAIQEVMVECGQVRDQRRSGAPL
jgi:integrase